MGPRRAGWLAILFVALAFVLAAPASAQPEPGEAPPDTQGSEQEAAENELGEATEEEDAPADTSADTRAALEEAKELFKKANSLRSAGDYERALDYYLRSRRAYASVPNTLNAALTLDHLRRWDEALEMYQELLTQFDDKLSDDERKGIATAMKTLRGRLGKLDISANVDGALLVDGRERGRLPLRSPLPVIPGKHIVRIIKDGYDTFETRVEVKAKETVLVDARLERLTRVGKLRVEDASLEGAKLYIDGAAVGTLPWEGTLSPGKHLYVVRKEDVGSAPRLATVIEGQTVLVEVKTGPLSPELHISVEPATARLSLDGVPLGRGGWHGSLPTGHYELEAREPGYHTARQRLDVSRDRGANVVLDLQVDEDHPRWGRREAGKPWVEVFGGVGLAPALGSEAEQTCETTAQCEKALAFGPTAGARGGWLFPIGASAELALGYFDVGRRINREMTNPYSGTMANYSYEDDLSVRGPFVSGGLGYQYDVGQSWRVGARLHVGVLFASVSNAVGGTASANGQTAPIEVEGSGSSVNEPAIFVAPELRALLVFDSLHVGLGLAAFVFPVTGPELQNGETRVDGTCNTAAMPLPIGCAPNTDQVAAERGFSSFVSVVPNVLVGYTF